MLECKNIVAADDIVRNVFVDVVAVDDTNSVVVDPASLSGGFALAGQLSAVVAAAGAAVADAAECC